MFWQERERKYLAELCAERGIEICEKGEKRENLSLPEFKQAMAEVNNLKEKVEELRIENAGLADEKDDLRIEIRSAKQVRDEIIKEAEDAEARVQKTQDILNGEIFTQNTLQEKYLRLAADAVADAPDNPVAQKIRNVFGQETGYVKVSESDWKKMLRIFRITSTKEKAVEEMAKYMADMEKSNNNLDKKLDKCLEFLKQHNLYEAFMEFVKSKGKERISVRRKLAEKKIVVEEREILRRGQEQKKKHEMAI